MVNKSHAAAYSVVSYYTAWLKHYYPAEYIAALMSHSDNSQFDMYINDARQVKVEVLPPDINMSYDVFVPEKHGNTKNIRFGLSCIKGMGVNAMAFVEERDKRGNYKSYADLVARCVISGIQKKALLLAIQAGATESLEGNYASHLNNAEPVHEAAKKELAKYLKAKPEATYEELYSYIVSLVDAACVQFSDILPGEKARKIKECIGTYLTGSPLEGVSLPTKGITLVQDINSDTSGVIKIAGYIDNIVSMARKADGAPMAKFVLGDSTGSLNAICFVNSYAQNRAEVIEGNVVVATGKVKAETDENGELTSLDFIVQTLESI